MLAGYPAGIGFFWVGEQALGQTGDETMRAWVGLAGGGLATRPADQCLAVAAGGKAIIEEKLMCRNIQTLFNYEPPVSEADIRAAAIQFVRKISGFNKPSKANEAAFSAAVDEIAAASSKLLEELETNAPVRNRADEIAARRARAAVRFSR